MNDPSPTSMPLISRFVFHVLRSYWSVVGKRHVALEKTSGVACEIGNEREFHIFMHVDAASWRNSSRKLFAIRTRCYFRLVFFPSRFQNVNEILINVRNECQVMQVFLGI